MSISNLMYHLFVIRTLCMVLRTDTKKKKMVRYLTVVENMTVKGKSMTGSKHYKVHI